MVDLIQYEPFTEEVQIAYLQSLGQKIRSFRSYFQLSQDELAAMAGITTRQLIRVEKGRVNTSILVLLKITRAMSIPLVEIIGRR
ncbi:MAG: helix-turn-helix domain-containing protein [Bacteroidia bacterium]|nr:helix-turn-helix domain-containing protein [Bacteroidia bacterium]